MIFSNPKMNSISTNATHSSFFPFLKKREKKIPIYLHSLCFIFAIAHRFASSSIALLFFLLLLKKIICVHSPGSQFSFIPINQVFICFGQTFHSYLYGSIQLVFLWIVSFENGNFDAYEILYTLNLSHSPWT